MVIKIIIRHQFTETLFSVDSILADENLYLLN